MSAEGYQTIKDEVNRHIWENLEVTEREMAYADALGLGAMALFLCLRSAAAPGDLDPTFNGTGKIVTEFGSPCTRKTFCSRWRSRGRAHANSSRWSACAL